VRETDEEMRRSLITEAVSEFAAPLRECRVLVTCREYAYKRGDAWHLPEADFLVVELDLFKEEQIAHFTQAWYRVVGPQKGWDEEKCQAEARTLRQAIQDWPHLQELAQYPLLLTLMAQVHGRDGFYPKTAPTCTSAPSTCFWLTGRTASSATSMAAARSNLDSSCSWVYAPINCVQRWSGWPLRPTNVRNRSKRAVNARPTSPKKNCVRSCEPNWKA
jgi:hypothetical protein